MADSCPACGRPFFNTRDCSGLTRNEAQTINLLLQEGLSNREIATRMGTVEQVVKNRLCKVYRKFGIHSRLELAALYAGTT
jgi:two-component system response regulator DevR